MLLKCGDHLVKARAVGPDPVAEHGPGLVCMNVFSSNTG
jgi:hypothetical protein